MAQAERPHLHPSPSRNGHRNPDGMTGTKPGLIARDLP